MKRKNSWLVGLVLTILIGWVYSAEASLIVSYNASQPVTNIIASYLPAGAVGYAWQTQTDAGRRDLGQSFLATNAFTLDKISFQASAATGANAASAPYKVKIFESAVATSIGSNISTQAGTYLVAGVVANNGWITFDMDDVNLTAGKTYTVMLSWDNAGASMIQALYNVATGTYADGKCWWGNNLGVYAATTRDLVFVAQGTAIPDTVASVGLYICIE